MIHSPGFRLGSVNDYGNGYGDGWGNGNGWGNGRSKNFAQAVFVPNNDGE